ncbi:MAG TPA: hypothetical protein VGR90_03705 [Acidimicrobiales bacterium]|nr:hypothetical protein [Acidimicrobiales bacterium]
MADADDADDAAPDGASPDDPDDLYEGDLGDPDARRTALPEKVEAWRRRTVTGAMLTGIARGLGQVFDPEKDKPAIVAEMPGAPPPPPGPVEAVIDPDDPAASLLVVKSWMLEREEEGEDAAEP